MDNIDNQLLSDLEEAGSNFIVPLRMREGFSEEHFEQLCQAIRNINTCYRDSDMLPKKAVASFVELILLIEGCMPFYNADAKVSKRIVEAIATFMDLMAEGY